MALEITGKLLQKLAEQTGEGKNGVWKKQDFIIETNDQFPKKVCISAWGDKVNNLSQVNSGDEITVSFNVESREYNGKWYTDLKAWKIDGSGSNSTIDPPNFPEDDFNQESSSSDDVLPF